MSLWGIRILLALTLFFLCISAESVQALTLTQNSDTAISARVGSLPSIDEETTSGGFSSGARFSGYAYPFATVTLQKGLTKVLDTTADERGYFSTFVPETTSQLFLLYATDITGRRSTLLPFLTVFYSSKLTDISGIRFAPTIATDKLSVRQGDFITIEGAALPGVPIEVRFDGLDEKTFTATADTSGTYSITVPLSISRGEYVVKTHYVGDTRFSTALRVIVGAVSISRLEVTKNIPGDCNVDQKVTLEDFSVLAYWFGKPNPPRCVDTNHDGRIDLVDFSILAFYWNG